MSSSTLGGLRTGSSGDAWERAARAGYLVSGALHVALGAVIVRIGLGAGGEADQTRLLASVGDGALGRVLLAVAALALLALAGWQAADAVREPETRERGRAAAKSLVYLALAASTASIALGSAASDQDSQAHGVAGALMRAPAGRVLVGAIGLGLVAAGAFHVIKGVTRRFEEDLRSPSHPEVGAGVRWLGTVGYVAKGGALTLVGGLFGYAALTADPDKAAGIDGAVERLRDAPAGPVLVVTVGLGFAAYGLYSLARSRYARM
ncbi:DUF1206 domain-containing protein [Demequina mangrovi]|uniref:DUF1206 domain-containing protein n=1 Tax=Demequina mangrovi TaxID=1043493 RepID=A0A1H6Y555_9MICO|nr:DUF1206 domain-containing protein [Demequina mangrovi]SEJ36428.1 protein of unknown function [Demequina mangrovi]